MNISIQPIRIILVIFLYFSGLSEASAATVIHFAESSQATNYSNGLFGAISRAVVFDFTIDAPLLANHSYNFGKANVESGESGNISDFLISAGTAASVLQFSDVPFKEYFNGNNVASFSRIHFETDINAAIVNYDILISGRSHADKTQYIQYHLQDYYYDNYGPSITALTLDISSGLVGPQTGALQCIRMCVASFAPLVGGGGASAVPEPSAWVLFIAGFGILGAAFRRGRRLGAFRNEGRALV